MCAFIQVPPLRKGRFPAAAPLQSGVYVTTTGAGEQRLLQEKVGVALVRIIYSSECVCCSYDEHQGGVGRGGSGGGGGKQRVRDWREGE